MVVGLCNQLFFPVNKFPVRCNHPGFLGEEWRERRNSNPLEPATSQPMRPSFLQCSQLICHTADQAVGRALIAHLVTSTKSAPLDDLKAVYAERDIVVTRLSDSICSV